MVDFNKTSRRGRLGASQVLIAAAVAAPLLVSAPASAQWFDEGIMPPRAIGQIVMRNGYSGFSPPRLAGDIYVVHAIDMDGARVRLVIDAYDGRILRPVRSVERLAPPRSVGRFRPRDYEVEIEREIEIEREYVERPRSGRPVRGALVPPRSIPGEMEPDDLMPRETRGEPSAQERGQRAAPSIAARPEPNAARPEPKQRAARVEQPARDTAAPPSRTKHRETSRSAPAAAPAAPAVTPAAPAPVVEAPKPASAPDAAPATTAAAPTPATPKEVPVTPAVPAPAIEAAKPAASAPAKPEAPQAAKPDVPQPAKPEPTQAAKPAESKSADTKQADTKQAADVSKPAAQREATASTSPAPAVRVIQGVTPIIPQPDGSSEPEKISQ